MARALLTVFLSYFLILTYVYPHVKNPALAWVLVVCPAVLLLVSLSAAIFYDRRTLSPFIEYYWQRLLIAFAVTAPIASAINHSPIDAAASSLLALLIVVISAASVNPLRFVVIAFGLSILGSIITYHLGANQFGYLPWHEAKNPTFAGISRVSLFPYLTDSAFFAILVLITAVFLRGRYFLISVPAAYFVLLSYSRTALIILAVSILSELFSWTRIRGSLNFLLVVAMIIVAVGFADRIVPSAAAVEKAITGTSIIQDTLTRRSVVPIDKDGNVVPLDQWGQTDDAKNPHLGGRAALWRDHITAFASSPWTGVGRQGAMGAIQRTAIDSSANGTESFFTRILAEFGVVALLFWAGLWGLFIHFDRQDNAFGRVMTIALVSVGAVYGSSMVPYNFVLICHLALIGYALKSPGPVNASTIQQYSSLPT